jgi:hypothetical protein
MSRNRRSGRGEIDVFANNNIGSAPDQLDNDIFSANAKEPTPVVNLIELDRISPDPTQPRHVLPSSIAHFRQNNLSFSDWFGAWRTAASEESGRNFDIDAYLDAKEDIERNENPGPIELALLQVVELAASIKRDGLTNPITVVRYGRDFTIETGERRFYAFQILYSRRYEEKWKRIPAQVSDKLNVWRQASENTARQDLNAIGRARQFAILLMELLKGEVAFIPYEAMIGPGISDRHFYAQVADGERFRVPRGKGEVLLNAMGLKNPQQLRDYRALLRLSDQMWAYADDHNLTEYEIYQMGDTVSHDTVSANSHGTPIKFKGKSGLYEVLEQCEIRSLKKARQLKNDTDKKEALALIAAHRRFLDDLERIIRDGE